MGGKAAVCFKKYVLLAYGVVLQAVGVALMYFSGMGSAPVAVMNEGMHLSWGMSVGTANYLVSLGLIIAALFLDRRYISIATFIMAFGTGYMIDYAMVYVEYIIPEVLTFTDQLILLAVSTLFICIGVGLIVAADTGTAAFEAFAIPLSLKIHVPYKYLCVIINFLFALVGWLLGGQIGICTLFFGTVSGFIIAFMTKVATATVARWFGLDGLAID